MGAVCLLLLDLLLGGANGALFDRQETGKFARIRTVMTEATEEVFIFGSSHAASHYVPDVLERELRMSCRNAGVLGQQILFHQTLASIVLARTTPAIVVLDVDPGTLFETKDVYDRLSDLKPFYARYPSEIGPVIARRSAMEPLFLRSRLYQYNSTLVHIARYAIAPQPDWNGYRPTYGRMNEPTPAQERQEAATRRAFAAGRPLDVAMIDALKRFITDATRRGVKVSFVVSPNALPYDLAENASFRTIEAIAREHGVPLHDFWNHPQFLRRFELFYDSGHLNDQGARLYSELVARALRRQMAGGAF